MVFTNNTEPYMGFNKKIHFYLKMVLLCMTLSFDTPKRIWSASRLPSLQLGQEMDESLGWLPGAPNNYTVTGGLFRYAGLEKGDF